MRKRAKVIPKNGMASSPSAKKSSFSALSSEQKRAISFIKQNDIIFLYGMAGTGKSYLAVNWGIDELIKGKFDKIILTRPCVEAYGEHLGYLPGEPEEKIAPYMSPLFQLLHKRHTESSIKKLVNEGKIVAIPLAFMRGLSFDNCYIVADEMQNSIPKQVRLLLSRIGDNSKMVINGDICQTDIKGKNGLGDAIERLRGIDKIVSMELTEESLVRNPIIAKIETRYREESEQG